MNATQENAALSFQGKVAIVTGAGGGLGRSHALALASRGAKVVVNDLASGPSGVSGPAQRVVAEILAAGGEAVANGASVTDEAAVQALVDDAVDRWGRVDILVNNAGVLRDKTFVKMSIEDFRLVLDVHLMGSVICTKAVWPLMMEQRFGRIIMTTSSSGLYGNFGQANYSAAKMALVGLVQTLGLEGLKYDIRVNCLAPTAATRMTEGLMSQEAHDALPPEAVSPAVLVLAAQDAPTRTILCAGAGTFEAAYITLTKGVHLGVGPGVPEQLVQRLEAVRNRNGEVIPESGGAQGRNEVAQAMAAARL